MTKVASTKVRNLRNHVCHGVVRATSLLLQLYCNRTATAKDGMEITENMDGFLPKYGIK
jgi:hypothetical protein